MYFFLKITGLVTGDSKTEWNLGLFAQIANMDQKNYRPGLDNGASS